jgi:hypothetical protein
MSAWFANPVKVVVAHQPSQLADTPYPDYR